MGRENGLNADYTKQSKFHHVWNKFGKNTLHAVSMCLEHVVVKNNRFACLEWTGSR
jgi:hypothetical protein